MATSVRLPDDLERRLTALADNTGRTKAFYVRQAIEQHIEDMEDYYDAVRILKSNTRTYTSEEVRAELGLDD